MRLQQSAYLCCCMTCFAAARVHCCILALLHACPAVQDIACPAVQDIAPSVSLLRRKGQADLSAGCLQDLSDMKPRIASEAKMVTCGCSLAKQRLRWRQLQLQQQWCGKQLPVQ